MNEPILLKGNKFGINIVMDDGVDFNSIKEALVNKLKESRKFFGSVKVNIAIEGRKTSKEENDSILEIINEHSDIEVVSIIDSQFKETVVSQKVEKIVVKEPVETVIKRVEPYIEDDEADDISCFHRGTLRSGQEVVSKSSIVVIGNVNDGAKVISDGNIVVIGKLTGYVTAGKGGNNEAFVVALRMNPSQIRIGNVVARSDESNTTRLVAGKDNPQIAYVEEGRIVIEDISQSTYESLSYK